MSRFAMSRQVLFVEEPLFDSGPARFHLSERKGGVRVAVPILPDGIAHEDTEPTLRRLTDELLRREKITGFVAWYYTPMMLSWSSHLRPAVVVYDCMDELSLFRGAPAAMLQWEQQLLEHAQLVFTGGVSLYEAKRGRHPHVHCFPSSIDSAHFIPARTLNEDPPDQAGIPHRRLGFAGVIDERMDLELLDAIARTRPEWQLVMVGPVVKIDPTTLPRRDNIHYLGAKPYADLPAYMAGWDVALMPFAMNESTRFISPTKTPEYLAAGCPVVSTPIRDVVVPYGVADLAFIGRSPDEFCAAIEEALTQSPETRAKWLKRVDGFLSTLSWTGTYNEMEKLIATAVAGRRAPQRPVETEVFRGFEVQVPLPPEQRVA